MAEITIVVARPGLPAERVQTENTLDALQALIGGDLEGYTPSFLRGRLVPRDELHGLHGYVNENGRRLALALNFIDDGVPILGALVVSRIDGVDGDEVGLRDEQVARVVEILDAVRREQRLLPAT